jgi:hypothetical protein
VTIGLASSRIDGAGGLTDVRFQAGVELVRHGEGEG